MGLNFFLSNFPLLDFEIFYMCLTFLGGKEHFFFKKCPNNGLVSEKNTSNTFYIDVKKCYIFYIFFIEGFTNYEVKQLNRGEGQTCI